MDSEKIDRIVILEKNVFADLKRCSICGINFTAIEPCILCAIRIEKEKELGRELTRKEFRDATKFLM